jgi:hypothetical protein
MNESPGVRPVVIQPQQEAAPSPRTLPRGATDMPLGLSANSVGLSDGGGPSLRRIALIGLPLTVVLALVLGIWLLVRSLAPLAPQTISNSSYEYNFLFYKSAETINLVAGEGLKYGDKALVIAKPTSDPVVGNCSQLEGGWREAMRVKVEGVERPVCVLHDSVFLVSFYHGDSRHMLEVTYTAPHAANTSDVRQIMGSVRVALP